MSESVRGVRKLSTALQGLVILAALSLLVGCQGLSTGSTQTQQQSEVGTLGLSSSSVDFGNVTVGTSKTVAITASNTGSASLTISSAAPTASQFSLNQTVLPITIAAGQKATLNVTFKPTAATSSKANLTIGSNASNSSLSLPLSGDGVAAGQLTLSPLTFNFGNVVVGVSQSTPVTLTNVGGSTVNVSQATISGSGFSVSGLNVPLSLAAGSSASFSVIFDPASAASDSGTLSITSDASNSSLSMTLSGTGVTDGTLSLNPASVALGSVLTGGSQKQLVTLTNTGGSSVNLSQASVSGAGFSLSGLTTPLTLTASQSTSFYVVFSPQSSGAVTGAVVFSSDASNPSLNLPVSGTGLAPGSLSPNPSSVDFSNVKVGSSQSTQVTLTNSSGASVTVTQITASGSGFSVSGTNLPVTLTAGQGTNFNVVFNPQSAGSVSGSVTVTSNASNSTLNIPLSGSAVLPGTMGPNPTSLSFGNVQVGSNRTLSETVTNTGGSSATISQVTLTNSAFTTSGITPPVTLTAGQSVTFNVIFAPSSATGFSGNLVVTSNASNPTLTIPLSGTGTPVGQLAVSPTSWNFGSVVVGTSGSQTMQLNASGTSVTVSSVNVNNSEFTITGITFPVTIAAGQSKQFTATFTPQATGATSATASFTSNASNSPTLLSLSGTGTAPPVYSVGLSWTASTSPNIAGYNVYRSTTLGQNYAKINSTLDGNTSYTDNNVTDGVTYYYVTTAVDNNNQESSYSTPASASIPAP